MKENNKNLNILNYEEFRNSKEFFNIKIGNFYSILADCLLGFIIIFFIWASCFNYDIVVKASVQIRPESNISIVKNFYSGKVKDIYYENGQFVEKNQKLMSLESSVIEEELRNLKLLQQNNLSNIETVRTIKKYIMQNYIDDYIVENEAILYTKMYFYEKEIKQKLFEKLDFDYQMEKLVPDLSNKKKLLQLKTDRDSALAELNYYDSQFRYDLLQQEKELEKEAESLKTKICELEQKLQYSIINAPITGTLEEISKYNVGDIITGNENLFRIIPSDEKLKAELYINDRDIADIKVGQFVKIKLYALNSSEYGQAKGFIKTVSNDTTYDSSGNKYYLVEVEIVDKILRSKKNGENVLRYGMTGEAKIITRQKKLLQFIFEKLNFLS